MSISETFSGIWNGAEKQKHSLDLQWKRTCWCQKRADRPVRAFRKTTVTLYSRGVKKKHVTEGLTLRWMDYSCRGTHRVRQEQIKSSFYTLTSAHFKLRFLFLADKTESLMWFLFHQMWLTHLLLNLPQHYDGSCDLSSTSCFRLQTC